MELVELTSQQVEELDDKLNAYDEAHMPKRMEGSVCIGLVEDGKLQAGLAGCITSYRTLYISTVFVDEAHRGKGLGRQLMTEMERRAIAMGVTLIRLDTFDWQGAAFYQALGYEVAGHYDAPENGFSEYFFVKHIGQANRRTTDENA